MEEQSVMAQGGIEKIGLLKMDFLGLETFRLIPKNDLT